MKSEKADFLTARLITEKPCIYYNTRLFYWRRRRDSNPRRAFDPYTISNRARSTNYATSACLVGKKDFLNC